MINQNELDINNLSYTNKDFQTIYPELLDIVKKLTNRWDPENSNESDPGIVLLKLLGFIGDKLNYNIDKNILECFMPSATQESSMDKLCNMVGYNRHYYRSATTAVSIMYVGDPYYTDPTDGAVYKISSIPLEPFTTVFTTIDGSSKYTLIDSHVVLNGRNNSRTCNVIEGEVKTLNVGNSTIINIDNVDDNNRIYFPEAMIAENGIFIYNNNIDNTININSQWEKVTNLNSSTPLSKKYMFGYDSNRGLPYVEFADNYYLYFENGITIKYTVTQGSKGNVGANNITLLNANLNVTATYINNSDASSAVAKYITIPLSNDNLLVKNLSATSTGKDPETINESYSNFKKTIGTFDHLITCRDYSNAIYNMESNTTNDYYVSNCQVTDRRTDFNYGVTIVSYNMTGRTTLHKQITDKNITAFDLCLYPLNPLKNNTDVKYYNDSFLPLDSSIRKEIINNLEDVNGKYACMSHDYKELAANDIYLIKTYYPITIKVTTTSKISLLEASDIINNIKTKLYDNFNPRNLEYGNDLVLDNLYEVVENSDTRIKNVIFDTGDPTIKVMLAESDEEIVIDETSEVGRNIYLQILAKNILAGRINLFDTDEEYKYILGQYNGKFINKVKQISTQVQIPGLDNNCTNYLSNQVDNSTPIGYTLRQNEYIELSAPNYVTEATYPMGIYYHLSTPNAFVIPANTEYKLKDNECLYIRYCTGDNGEKVVKLKYEAGKIIKPNFDFMSSDKYQSEGNTAKYYFNEDEQSIPMFGLTTNEEIQIRRELIITLDSSNLECFWLRNNPGNRLFTPKDRVEVMKILPDGTPTADESVYYYEIVLKENESFLYTDSAHVSLTSLGSGTKLTYTSKNEITDSIDPTKNPWVNPKTDLTIEDITSDGLAAFDTSMWLQRNFSEYPLKYQEMMFYIFSEGDSLYISPDMFNDNYNGIDTDYLSNIPSHINRLNWLHDNANTNIKLSVSYKYSGEDNVWTELPYVSDGWSIKSRLDINSDSSISQKLVGPQEGEYSNTQEYSLIVDDGTLEGKTIDLTLNNVDSEPLYILSNNPLSFEGGQEISVNIFYNNINLLTYNKKDISYVKEDGLTDSLDYSTSGYRNIALNNIKFSNFETVEEEYFIDMATQGFENSQEVTSLVIPESPVSISFDKGINSNSPKYYDSGNSIRCYGGNTITVSSNDFIRSIEFTFGSGENSNEIIPDKGSFVSPVWVNSNQETNSVTFTISGTTGQRRIQAIKIITYKITEPVVLTGTALGKATIKIHSLLRMGMEHLFMFYWDSKENSPITSISLLANENCSLSKYNSSTGRAASSSYELEKGINIIKLDIGSLDEDALSKLGEDLITITINKDATSTQNITDTLIFSEPHLYKGISEKLKLTDDENNKLLQIMSEYDIEGLFDYTSTVNNLYVIDVEDYNSVQALYDSNNIVNSFVLPVIDFENSNISVHKSSIKQ